MKIAISGSTGFIGKNLIQKFKTLNWDIITLNRTDFLLDDDWISEKINGVDVIINLSGANISKRWTKKYKTILYNSRINTTKRLVNIINNLSFKPDLFISTSAVGIYDSYHIHNEKSTFFADNFLAIICKDWELEAFKSKTRTIVFRLSVVIDKYNGAFPKLLLPFKMGVGGKIGDGNQYFSWIHIEDLVNIYLHIINNSSSQGIYNISAPDVIKNRDLTKKISKKMHKPSFFTIPKTFLKFLLGENSIVVTEGQHIICERLINEGFSFKYKNADSMLDEILKH